MVEFLYEFVWSQNFAWGLLLAGTLATTAMVGLRWQENPAPSSK